MTEWATSVDADHPSGQVTVTLWETRLSSSLTSHHSDTLTLTAGSSRVVLLSVNVLEVETLMFQEHFI